MPRNTNPKNIKLGAGQTVPNEKSDISLSSGEVIGGGSGSESGTGLVAKALKAHINDPKNAHESFAIGIGQTPPLTSTNIEGSVQELVGGMPYEPPMLGKFTRYMDFNCVPDWGSLKLDETPIYLKDSDFDSLVNTNDFGDVFPYFLNPPNVTNDWETMNYDATLNHNQSYSPGFAPSLPKVNPDYDNQVVNAKYNITPYNLLFPSGGDIMSDRVFNYPDLLGVRNPTNLKSGGRGRCYAGGFTRSDGNIEPTLRLMSFDSSVDKWPMLATLSGCIYPADRGVLALLHFPYIAAPTSTDPWSTERKNAFLAQDLLDRCIAALLLGQGVLGDGCIDPILGSTCDGEAGGIFGSGLDSNGEYDPFAFPGRASGQYDLNELHTGTSVVPASTLPAPWDNLTGQGIGAGAKRNKYVSSGDDYYPAAGQVRLGSDPDTNGGVILTWGIPVLGATSNAYISLTDTWTNYALLGKIGHSVIDDTNHFKYRLPVLDDYSEISGMKYTPKSDVTNYGETYRYLQATDTTLPTNNPYDYGLTPSPATFNVGGNYPAFQQDCFDWQIAHYRHTFAIDGNLNSYANTGLGSYALFHFKTEKDFEDMVENGVVPDELYGVHFLSASSNIVNDNTAITDDPVYAGPIPNFGYSSEFYQGIRDSLYVTEYDKGDRGDIDTAEFTWSVEATNTGVMWVSGVAYFTPLKLNGDQSFHLDSVAVQVANVWGNGYRMDDNPGTGLTSTYPAVINSPNTGIFNLKSFVDDTTVAPGSWPDVQYRRDYLIEIPYTDLGTHGGNPYSLTNGPVSGEDLIFINSDQINPPGTDTPSFSLNAKPWFYVRKPFAQEGDWEDAILPSWDTTHGHGFDLTDTGSDIIQLHTTGFFTTDLADPAAGTGVYGNYTITSATTSFTIDHYSAFDSLMTADKDTTELFLDEVYRYQSDVPMTGIPTEYQPIFEAINGPGMSTWNKGPIPTPVQIGKYHVAGDFSYPWDTWGTVSGTQIVESLNNMSWIQTRKHLITLKNSAIDNELQVQGLPPRNPPLLDWAKVPFPSAGLLRYPAIDYTADSYRPDTTDDTSAVLLDYSGTWGDDIKNYIRVFDAAFSRGSNPIDVSGQPFVTLRLDGVKLEDFAYTAPGHGTLYSSTLGLAVQIKVPGLTTWMDAGRPDNTGPSKQDPALDGAGCKVIGQYTFDGIDAETGMVYCQLHVNVGPMVNLAFGVGNEIPVMVKISMNRMAVGTGDLVGSGSGTSGTDIRGLIGIRLVHPDDRVSN